jgi:epoxyqueuosine reductase
VLERDLAARAGLGWIGKNTSVIGSTLGSYFLIGVVLTTAAMELDAPVADRCGSCTACLEACPTAALVAPYVLDARRCISYLTIEHRGEIPAEFRGALHGWIFGCDICQEVCPWNRKASVARDSELAPRGSLGELAELRGADDEHLRARFRQSALWRAKAAGLRRNVALVLAARERAEGAADDDSLRRSYTRS